MTPLWIALAGGLGAGARFAVESWMRPRVSRSFPWSTHLVNVTGSFLLGLVLGIDIGESWHAIAGAGLLGGFTTFGTVSVETAHLALDRRPGAALANVVAMLVVSVAAAALGLACGRATA